MDLFGLSFLNCSDQGLRAVAVGPVRIRAEALLPWVLFFEAIRLNGAGFAHVAVVALAKSSGQEQVFRGSLWRLRCRKTTTAPS